MSKYPFLIDCNYLYPQVAAAYLIQEGDQAVFIENNTTHSVPLLLEALKKQGLHPDQVRYLIVTHVHLDHAGGSSALMQQCRNATLLAHKKAAFHLIDPSKLVKSARQVYGDLVFEKLYGEMGPIDASRVRVMEDGETLSFGSREFLFFYTRGHADHHFCVFDSFSEGVFSGDAFGIAYPIFQSGGRFIFPSTSPTGFDPVEAQISVQKIIDTGAKSVFLTHFGEIKDIQESGSQLMEHLDWSARLLEKAIHIGMSDNQLVLFCESEIRSYYQKMLDRNGARLNPQVVDLLKLDFGLNAAGIAYVAQKRRKASV